MDFGLAKQSGAETRSMTMAGAGTLAYMSPEQVRNDHVDPRSDIWSLGVLMYQMVTGRRPFEGDYDASVLYSIVNDKHLPAVEAGTDIPPQIDCIIERALNKSPGDRYGSMEDMRNDLIEARRSLFGDPDDSRTGRGFIAGTTHIFGWKLTSVFALSVSAILIFFILRYVITGGKDRGLEPAKTEVAVEDGELSEAEVFYSSGEDLYHSGKQTKGIPLIEHALELDPEHLDALKTLAVFYDWGGDYERAAGYIERAKNIADRKGNTADYAICTIIQAKVLHNWDLALKLFREYYDAHPEAVTTFVETGYILSRYIGDNEGALENYALFFEKDPDNTTGRHAQVYNYTGTAWLYSGEFSKAIEAFTKYKDLLPDSPSPVSSIAGAYLFYGDHEEAYRLYSTLLQLDDPAYTVHEGLGRSCSETGRLRESNEHYHRYLGSVTFKGQKINGHLQIAKNYLLQKDEVSFDREMALIDRIDPDAAQACWLRGVRLITLNNDTESARFELERLTALMEKPFVFEETSRHEHLRGLILLSEARTAGALEAMQESARRSPRDFFFFGREYARVLLQTGRTDEAIERCLDLSRFNSNDPELMMILSDAYSIKGDIDSSKEYYDRVLETLSEADSDFVPLIEFRNRYGVPDRM